MQLSLNLGHPLTQVVLASFRVACNSHRMPPVREILERVFREEYGLIIASLIRRSGSFDLAEEALQEAFSTALTTWNQTGTPTNAAAWLTRVAHRKLLDMLRREKTRSEKQPELEYEARRQQDDAGNSSVITADESLDSTFEYTDDRLRLIFTCCHPSLSQEAQVALTLRTLGGLSTSEIAKAFLIPETTLAQRLVRAKNKIRLAGIPYEIPAQEVLAQRLTAVQSVVYLIFNEGYTATTGDSLIRNDLCAEAIRLARILCRLLPSDSHGPENLGLLALILLQDSRRNARVNVRGELMTLEEQDRSLWDQAEIAEGLQLVEIALRRQRLGAYQLQAAIAAVHAEAKTPEQTDWRQIVALYDELRQVNPSPVVALNHAAAVAMSAGFEQGLSLIDNAGATGQLDQYYLFHAARADLLRRLGRTREAHEAYSRAMALTPNQVEQAYYRRRMSDSESA